MNIVNLSGGKDSTAMLHMMIDRHITIDRIILIDTTKEFPQMYDHIALVQRKIAPMEIEIYKIDFDYFFAHHIKRKGKRIGERGYGWPNIWNRWCTALKRDMINKHIALGDICHIGIAADESKRIGKNQNRLEHLKYPLVEWGVSEQEALQYCYNLGYSWGGLYDKMNRVSCWCCPLQRINELNTLYVDYPELWKQLISMDHLSRRQFRIDYSVKELTTRFHMQQKKKGLDE